MRPVCALAVEMNTLSGTHVSGSSQKRCMHSCYVSRPAQQVSVADPSLKFLVALADCVLSRQVAAALGAVAAIDGCGKLHGSAAAAVPTHRLPQSPAPRRPFFPTLLPAAWAPSGVGGES